MILLIGSLETNFNEILIEIYTFSFKKMHLKTSSGKLQPFSPGNCEFRLERKCGVFRSHERVKNIVWSGACSFFALCDMIIYRSSMSEISIKQKTHQRRCNVDINYIGSACNMWYTINSVLEFQAEGVFAIWYKTILWGNGQCVVHIQVVAKDSYTICLPQPLSIKCYQTATKQ